MYRIKPKERHPSGCIICMKLKKTLAVILTGLLLSTAAAPAITALEPFGHGLLMRKWLTNDPNYQFSEAYKTSVWYQNFTDLSLTDNDRNNILRIAVSQLGYHEGDSAADFDGMNTSGSGNYIEYARLLIPHYNDNAYEWCACFVNWCLNQAHFDKASSEIGCWKWTGELKEMGMWQDSAAYKGTYTPKPADFIFFNWNYAETGNRASGHIGYVLYTTETHVFTIEGNADNNVTVRSYELNDPRVIGYGTPPYDEGTEPTLDYAYTEGMPRGQYVVNGYNAALKKAPGATERVCRVPAGAQVTLRDVEGDYARVTYGDSEGYLPCHSLYLLIPALGEDILTFDANGGTGAPEAMTVPIGEAATLPDTIPTLEGDTFLGWSAIPYNVKVDGKPGESMSLSGDTVLYAVWEKRSLELAEKAAAEGLVPEYERPTAIQNSGALLMGTLDPSLFSECGDTEVKAAEDESLGKVLSFVSTSASADPYVTLPYGALMDTLRLAPIRGEDIRFVILRVKDVSMNNLAMDLTFNGNACTSTALLELSDDWQYAVFDLAGAGFEGELSTLRIDWERAADQAGNTMYLSEICFTSSEAVKDAILEGKYVYPAQELLEPETETETAPETATEPVTPPASEQTTDTETKASESGCFATVTLPSLAGLVTACAAFVALGRKKH